MPVQVRLGALAIAAAQLLGVGAHYGQQPCQPDEVRGEVQGATGYMCSPKCSDDGYNCPTDIPGMANAQPQCMLQDVNKNALCGLLCQMDSQCPSGSQCKTIQQMQVGVCLYAISFADWARQSDAQKLAVGWPTGSDKALGFQIAKTQSALQNMKSRYSIEDNDADLVMIKDLVASLKAPGTSGAGTLGGSGASAASSGTPATVQIGGDNAVGLEHDVTQFAKYANQGIPGFEQEIKDTVWNIEHLDRKNSATHLLSGILWIVFLYLGVGGLFSYQQGARGFDMIPHLGFWAEYPKLVNDGVAYSKILLGFTPIDDSITGGLSGAPRSGAGAFQAL